MNLHSRVMLIWGAFPKVPGTFQAGPLLMILDQKVKGRSALVGSRKAEPAPWAWSG